MSNKNELVDYHDVVAKLVESSKLAENGDCDPVTTTDYFLFDEKTPGKGGLDDENHNTLQHDNSEDR